MTVDRLTLFPMPTWPVVVEQPPPALAPTLAERVDQLWQQELSRRGAALHDGRLFSVTRHQPGRIEGCFRPYRHWIAQRVEPALAMELAVQPLAVSGLVRVGDRVLFGRRGAMTQDAGQWELPPSGGIDDTARDAAGNIDPGRQLMVEFHEELGIPAANSRLEPFAMIIDSVDRVIDLAIELIPDPHIVDRIVALPSQCGGEYVEFRLVDMTGLEAFCWTGERPLSAVSRRLLEARGLLAQFQGR